MKKVINSMKTDNSGASYYNAATIVDGKIVELYEERGREGGIIWRDGYDKQLTKECFIRWCEHFPNFFQEVMKYL